MNIGRLTRNIEIRYLNSGLAIAKTSIATNHVFIQNGEKKQKLYI